MRKVGEILSELLSKDFDENTRILIKELNNACGSMIKDVKDEINSAVYAEKQSLYGIEGEYISITVLEDIIRNAGNNL